MAGELKFGGKPVTESVTEKTVTDSTPDYDTDSNPDFITLLFAKDNTSEHKSKRFEVWVSDEDLEILGSIKKKYNSSYSGVLRVSLRVLYRNLKS